MTQQIWVNFACNFEDVPLREGCFFSLVSAADYLSIGQINPTQVYNLAGKHINNGVVISEDEFVQTSWGIPFDLDVLAEVAQPDSLDLNNINFVRIVDIPGNGAFTDAEGNPIYDPWQTPIPGSGGFDLEAIGVINAQAVPEPSTALGILILSLSGICLGRSQRRSRF
ncbi:MAG: PEP-CTERM sorting domain-containing protein [Cyanobacteriota bacterium]|nr:PEP-CTERM sorting domain-containing protein [Cyanobacteriota bacterium]